MKKIIAISVLCIGLSSCNRDDSCCPVKQKCTPKPVPCCPNGNQAANTQMYNDGSHTDADWKITARVKKEIMSDSKLSNSARFVSVSTTDGVVTLSGTVGSQDEANMLVRKVQAISGVQSVDNQLVVSQN